MPPPGAVRTTWQALASLLAVPDAAPTESQAPVPVSMLQAITPEVIRLVALMYVRFPLSLLNVEDLLFKRGIDVFHKTIRFCIGLALCSPATYTECRSGPTAEQA